MSEEKKGGRGRRRFYHEFKVRSGSALGMFFAVAFFLLSTTTIVFNVAGITLEAFNAYEEEKIRCRLH